MSDIARILKESRIVAVVGLSPKPHRASFQVADYLQVRGYRVLPVNPACAGQEILGERCHATLAEAATWILARLEVDST